MGDISELRGLVLVVSFLGALVLIMGLIPSEFYVMGDEREVIIPEEWQGIDLQAFKETWNSTSINSLITTFAIGGRNLQWSSSYLYDNMVLRQQYGFGLLWYEAGTWYNRRGTKVSYISDFPNQQQIGMTQLNTDYSTYGNVEFTVGFVENAPFTVQTFFTFNETTYATPSEAWNNDDLNVLIGIDFDNINTSYNAWDLIAMLLFFQLPDVHWIVNAFIAIPIWVTVAYMAYVLIIKVIPLIAGG